MALTLTAKNRAIWGVRILLALAFGAAGSAKLAGVEQMVATFEAIGWGRDATTGKPLVLNFDYQNAAPQAKALVVWHNLPAQFRNA